jgi:hypothetical protein
MTTSKATCPSCGAQAGPLGKCTTCLRVEGKAAKLAHESRPRSPSAVGWMVLGIVVAGALGVAFAREFLK